MKYQSINRHIFNFEGGDYLTTMGASWFISYSYFLQIDQTHTNWQNVSTYQNRISVFMRTKEYHQFWISEVIQMNDRNLEKNKLSLKAHAIKQMAKALIQWRSDCVDNLPLLI